MDKEQKLSDWEEREVKDRNRNGLDDAIEPPETDVSAGRAQLAERFRQNPGADPSLTGGDVDAAWEMAESQGDEAVAGSMPTPGQGVIDDIGRGMGVTYQDDEELKFGEKERSRDKDRWELDPASSEDYRDRLKDQS
jgi:hypothetical protein